MIQLITPQQGRPDGYGQSSLAIKKYIQKQGVYTTEKPQDTLLCYGRPLDLIKSKAKHKVLVVMFESTMMPEEWRVPLNIADVVISPSTFCTNVIKGQFGIDAITIPLGYDSAHFAYYKRPKRKTYTYLHYNSFTKRKGFIELIQAWSMSMKDNKNVKLILKTTTQQSLIDLSHLSNIEIIQEDYTPYQMQELLQRSDCLIFPSMGEGFGHNPLEAMATGADVIAPNEHGIAEYHTPLIESVKTYDVPAEYDKYAGRDMGRMFSCQVSDLADKINKVYNEREQRMRPLYQKRRAEYARNYTLDNFARELIKHL